MGTPVWAFWVGSSCHRESWAYYIPVSETREVMGIGCRLQEPHRSPTCFLLFRSDGGIDVGHCLAEFIVSVHD